MICLKIFNPSSKIHSYIYNLFVPTGHCKSVAVVNRGKIKENWVIVQMIMDLPVLTFKNILRSVI